MACEACSSASFNEFPLPAEIMTEILLRLPVKSILKLRCVSKSWLALISSHKFINIHLNLSANKEDTQHILISEELGFGDKWIFKEFPLTSLFYDDSVIHALDLGYPIENNKQCLCVFGSCNGLVLLSDDEIDFALVWNPTIRKHKKLPFFRPRWKQYWCTYGFGFDEVHDDYRVVGIFYNNVYDESHDVEVKIYSLKSDSWTSGDYFEGAGATNYEETLDLFPGLFVDGMLHWHRGRNIISFDLANEKWVKMEKPCYEVGENESTVGTLGGDLCIFSDYNKTHLCVWVMKEYGVKESWMKLLTFKYPNDQNILDSLLFMSNKGEMLFNVGPKFRIYNSKHDLFRHPNLTNYQGIYDMEFYIESLVSPFSTGVANKLFDFKH